MAHRRISVSQTYRLVDSHMYTHRRSSDRSYDTFQIFFSAWKKTIAAGICLSKLQMPLSRPVVHPSKSKGQIRFIYMAGSGYYHDTVCLKKQIENSCSHYETKPGLYESIKGQLSQEYIENDFDITEKDKELAQRKVSLMVKDTYTLHRAFENHNQVKHYETFKILSRVFTQQCEVKDTSGAEPEIIIKEKPDKDTICTPHNPEARYVRKGKQRVTGDKAFVTETCSSENKTQFITDVELLAATASDSDQQPEIQQRLIDNNFKPEKQYGDAGFVNGKTILESEEKWNLPGRPFCRSLTILRGI